VTSRAATVAIVLACSASASAEPTADPITDEVTRDANLEIRQPREGITFSAALGGGLRLAREVGLGGAVSFRFGHVATRSTVITLELAGGSVLHRRATMDRLVRDDNFGLLLGTQHYTSPSFWIRGAGGLTSFAKDVERVRAPSPGIGGLVGAGLDVARRGRLVLGVESFAMLSVIRDEGVKIQTFFGLGLSHY
jgi:hypothetical protein